LQSNLLFESKTFHPQIELKLLIELFQRRSNIYTIQGIDVSKWQGTMDWNIALSAGIRFAIIKAGGASKYGNYPDPQFERNAAECAALSIPVGYYWYFYPTIDPIEQADYFWELVKGKPRNLPLVLDLENSQNLTPKELTNRAGAFTRRMFELSSEFPMLYSRSTFLHENTIYADFWSQMELWIARYTVKRKPWSNPGDSSLVTPPYWDDWVFWQHSNGGNGRGAEFGADSKSIDLNYFNGDEAAFELNAGLVPEPIPVGIVPIETVEVLATVLNIRALPDVNSADLGNLLKGCTVPVTAIEGDWKKIEGWIHGDYTQRV
jgi:lysozyme